MEYYIAWWNLENLFDVIDSNDRPEWLQSKLKSELEGWDATVLNKKITQLSHVFTQLNEGNGPDILGVCEVENRAVLEKLLDSIDIPGRRYAVVHSDTKDARGIDIAFIYDSRLFYKPRKRDIFHHVVLKRNATRDILQVNFKTKTAQKTEFVVIGNHWPSRLGGEFKSEPYRIIAAETLSYWLERIPEIFQKEVAVIVMGDFNDEPFNRSISEYALGLKDSSKVRSKRSQNPYLFNLMWRLQEDGIGTHYYNGWGMLDQILVNRAALLNESGLQMIPETCGIFNNVQLIKSGKPRRFGRPSSASSHDTEGFSDHLPVFVKCREVPVIT